MTVLLIQPSFFSTKAEELAMKTIHHPSIGLSRIEAVLKLNNINCKIIDLNIEPWSKVNEYISINQPQIIGITGYTFIASKMGKIAKDIRHLFPNIVLVGGGVHATYYYKELLAHNTFDFIIRFEGEQAFYKLCEEIIRNTNSFRSVPNLAFKNGPEIITTKVSPPITDLDSLPIPTFDLSHYPNKIVPIETSRGCPYKCIYCSSSAYWGTQIRYRSIQNIQIEIEHHKNKGFHTFNLIDDQLNANSNRFHELLAIFKDERIQWVGACVINNLTPESIDKIKESGCQGLNIGIESADPLVQKKAGKLIDLEHAYKMIKYAQEVGIKTVCGFILFHYCDTKESIQTTIDFSKKIQATGARVRFTYNTPFRGTYQYDHLHELALLIQSNNLDEFDLSNPVINTAHFNMTEMRSILDVSKQNISSVDFSKIQKILEEQNIQGINDPRLNIEFIQKLINEHLN